MTIKKTNKPATKPAAYKASASHVALAAQAGLNLRNGESAREAVTKACGELHKAKAVIGDARTCPLAQAFLDKRFPLGKGVSGKKVSAQVMANALSAFRSAVKTGKGYNENAGRDKAKAKGKTGAKTSGGNVMIVIGAGDKPQAVAVKLRKGFEKLRGMNDEFASLAAFLVDALDDAGFTESDE
jgi:hypothetical protein